VVLRAHGAEFDVDAFVAGSPWSDINVYRRGEAKHPRSKPNGERLSKSRLDVAISEADFDAFRIQVEDATRFLRCHATEIKRLVRFVGVEAVGLDFPISRRDVFLQSDTFPADLVRLAGDCGIYLEQSHYPPTEDETDSE